MENEKPTMMKSVFLPREGIKSKKDKRLSFDVHEGNSSRVKKVLRKGTPFPSQKQEDESEHSEEEEEPEQKRHVLDDVNSIQSS